MRNIFAGLDNPQLSEVLSSGQYWFVSYGTHLIYKVVGRSQVYVTNSMWHVAAVLMVEHEWPRLRAHLPADLFADGDDPCLLSLLRRGAVVSNRGYCFYRAPSGVLVCDTPNGDALLEPVDSEDSLRRLLDRVAAATSNLKDW